MIIHPKEIHACPSKDIKKQSLQLFHSSQNQTSKKPPNVCYENEITIQHQQKIKLKCMDIFGNMHISQTHQLTEADTDKKNTCYMTPFK